MPVEEAKTFVGVAGTFTTLAALALGLETYDRSEIHGSELKFDALRVMTSRLVEATSAQRAMHPVIHPGRADVIGGGGVVVNGIIDLIKRTNKEATSFVISERDILDGIVAGLADGLPAATE